jgi:pimeloyl-ACP methyl ester carboxylesterase
MKLLPAAMGLAITAAVLYGAVCAGLYGFQRSLLYHPQPARASVPGVRLPVAGAELQISVRPMPGAKALLYFGGNAEDVSATLADLAQSFPDHALYLMHYRGYGTSTGEPAEAALHADAEVLWQRVSGSHDDITLMGRSLGSGVAVKLASEHAEVSHLILVTPYDSIAAVAADHFPWLPVRWLMSDTFDSVAWAPRLAMPVTVVSAERDEVIGRQRTAALVDRLPTGGLRWVQIPGAGHNDLQLSPLYAAALVPEL